MITNLLNKDLLSFVDELSREVFASGSVRVFPYKTMSETLNLVLVSMLRELVKAHDGKSFFYPSNKRNNLAESLLGKAKIS